MIETRKYPVNFRYVFWMILFYPITYLYTPLRLWIRCQESLWLRCI